MDLQRNIHRRGEKMSVYKDEKKGTWYVSVRYTDWTGERKKKMKRGFRTKKEAQMYEAKFISQQQVGMDIKLGDFVEVYFNDKENELSANSKKNKRHIVEKHIVPYFGDRKMSEITPAEIIQWQKEIQSKGYKPTYERDIQKELSCLFNHATKIYNHSNTACSKVKKMGKSGADKFDFWTKAEYEEFIRHLEKGSEDYIMFEILFWTGCREGEMLALTPNDFDFKNGLMHITKTYNRIKGEDILGPPKTESSVRTIAMPQFLCDEIRDYIDSKYEFPVDGRLFNIVPRTLQVRTTKLIEKTGVKKIRIHDLRHSHVAYLIHQGVEPLVIKERLGHSDIRMTLNVYGHLYPSKQRNVAKMLDRER